MVLPPFNEDNESIMKDNLKILIQQNNLKTLYKGESLSENKEKVINILT
jgi:hypothetical protein